MTKIRGFEIVSKFKNQNINLPKRSTFQSAGYDIEAAEDTIIPSHWIQVIKYVLIQLGIINNLEEDIQTKEILKPTLVPTGLKAYMLEDEYLQIINRSSNPIKKFLMLPNSVGIIDADYYNNPSNEGHIYVQLINYGIVDIKVNKGDRIAQGIFSKFLKVDMDNGGNDKRIGGFGSSDKS